MTGHFTRSGRTGPCVISDCKTLIHAGELVYLWKGIDRQTVCLGCAKSRWGYDPTDAPIVLSPAPARESIGFDSAKQILQSLQRKANAGDPKLRQVSEVDR